VYTVDYVTPDSAATATAILGGQKTHMGVFGLHQDAVFANCSSAAGREINSILHEAHLEGEN
jgi:alkaline phosphatase